MCNNDSSLNITVQEYIKELMEEKELITFVVDDEEKEFFTNSITLGKDRVYIKEYGEIEFELIEEVF